MLLALLPALAVAVEPLLAPAPPLALAGDMLPPVGADGAGLPPAVLELWVVLSTGLLLQAQRESPRTLKKMGRMVILAKFSVERDLRELHAVRLA